MKNWWALPIIGALLLSACGNSGRNYVKSEMAETLEITILPNASKMFTYRLRWPEDQIPSHIYIERGSGSASKTQGGIQVGRTTYERLVENASYVVEHSGYCRKGFLELDRSMSRYHLWIRGECRDSATSEDRDTFQAAQTLGPEYWRNKRS